MRFLPSRKSVRGLFAAEGYLELELPHRALDALDRIANAGELEPYSLYLRGQALRQLDRYGEAIEALHEAARTIPAPFNRRVWEDLSDCFRHEGLHALAEVAEVFAEDPEGGVEGDFTEPPFRSGSAPAGRNRSAIAFPDDFEQYDFDGTGCGDSTTQKPPKK